MTQVAQVAVAIGILFTYTLQFFIAIQVLWPITKERIGLEKDQMYHEMIFRAIVVLFTCEYFSNLNFF